MTSRGLPENRASVKTTRLMTQMANRLCRTRRAMYRCMARAPWPVTVPRVAPRSKGQCGRCREHIICPLPRANDRSALTAVRSAMAGWEASDALSPGGRGVGHDSARSDRAGGERRAHVDPGGGDPGLHAAQHSPLAPAVRTVRLRRAV